MQIIGEKHLKNNTYSSIKINRDKIVIYGDENISLFDEEPIESEYINKSSKEIISNVINKFLVGNAVGGIIHGCTDDGKDRNIVVSTNERTLIIDTHISKEDTKMIYEKYKLDRSKALKENDKKCKVTSKHENSSIYKTDEEKIEFNLAHKKNAFSVHKIEVDFLSEMVETLFEYELVAIRSKYSKLYGTSIFEGFELIGTENYKSVELEHFILYDDELREIVKEHNKKVKKYRKENMQMQIKMKGF